MQQHKQIVETMAITAIVFIFMLAFFFTSFFLFESIIKLLIVNNVNIQNYWQQ